MSTLSRKTCEALDRLDRVATLWRAIACALDPDFLNDQRRDALGCGLQISLEEYSAARANLAETLEVEQELSRIGGAP